MVIKLLCKWGISYDATLTIMDLLPQAPGGPLLLPQVPVVIPPGSNIARCLCITMMIFSCAILLLVYKEATSPSSCPPASPSCPQPPLHVLLAMCEQCGVQFTYNTGWASESYSFTVGQIVAKLCLQCGGMKAGPIATRSDPRYSTVVVARQAILANI